MLLLITTKTKHKNYSILDTVLLSNACKMLMEEKSIYPSLFGAFLLVARLAILMVQKNWVFIRGIHILKEVPHRVK